MRQGDNSNLLALNMWELERRHKRFARACELLGPLRPLWTAPVPGPDDWMATNDEPISFAS
eukprot:5061218-Alexandrium_andersonii.AAC.1